jgi:hypothetical protein
MKPGWKITKFDYRNFGMKSRIIDDPGFSLPIDEIFK